LVEDDVFFSVSGGDLGGVDGSTVCLDDDVTENSVTAALKMMFSGGAPVFIRLEVPNCRGVDLMFSHQHLYRDAQYVVCF
jgi:hypothetical protein